MNLMVPHGFEANYVAGFARGLAANGVRLMVLSCDELSPQLEAAGIPQRNIRGSENPARPVWEKAATLLRYYARLFWIVFTHRGATIHFNGQFKSRFILFEGFVLPPWFRLWAGRYVYTAHNALPHGREQSRLFRWAYRWIYRFPHRIIVHTEKIAQQLESQFAIDRSRMAVISIGLNEEMPDTDLSAPQARRRLGLCPTGPLALFFGKIEPYKGVDLLVEAWNRIRTPEARLAIAGLCPDPNYALQLRDALAQSPRSGTMEWREGFVPNEDVAVWLRACDVVVLPYRSIYQSGVVFLCLRFGVPMVATDVGSLTEYIHPDAGLIAPTNDPEGIADALDRFFADPNRYCRDAIARSAAENTWERLCLTIRHLYR
jgi:glycosyltransferase involved in cell wall biosynthesis